VDVHVLRNVRKELYSDTFIWFLTDHSGHYAYILVT